MSTASMRPPAVPAPPDPFDPLEERLAAGMRLWRCHPLAYGGDSFNPTESTGRFRPIRDTIAVEGRTSRVANPSRTWVPTAYAGDSIDAAISEGPFHDLPVSAGPKYLPRATVEALALTPVVCTRELRLVSLRGHGMRRVGANQATLIEPGPPYYPETAPWGRAAFEGGFDGIVWVSRQFPGGGAFIVFGANDAPLTVDGATLPLAAGKGFELLSAAANAAVVVIAER